MYGNVTHVVTLMCYNVVTLAGDTRTLLAGDVTRVLAIDDRSRFIAAFSTMPIKDNAIIYNDVYWYSFYSLEFQTLSEESCTYHISVLREAITFKKLLLSLAANLKGNPETGNIAFRCFYSGYFNFPNDSK